MNVRCRQLTFRSFSICSLPVQISKVNDRIATGDVAGANASSYTLTEQLPKFFLQEAEGGCIQLQRGRYPGSIQARSRAAQP